ncbi:MAG: GIY-YIG nuclease family protein, partial [Peptostreptococcaceae bacterium]
IMDIKEKIKSFPQKPGIYMMLDNNEEIIYVGKSKSLRARIKSYFYNSNNHSRKIKRMVKNIKDIKIIETDTELDALILECKKIHEIKPMYNTLMKKHENYKYLKIDIKDKIGIYVTDIIEADGAHYFGPYTMDKKLEEIKSILLEAYKLPICYKYNKCIRFDLNKCIGPCRDKNREEYYIHVLNEIQTSLNENSDDIINKLTTAMNKEVENLNFENAELINNNITLIKSLMRKQDIITNVKESKFLLCWIKLNNLQFKIYLIHYGDILYSQIVSIKDCKKNFKDEITLEVSKNVLEGRIEDKKIDKAMIDYINIIYNYIENNDNINYLYLNKF